MSKSGFPFIELEYSRPSKEETILKAEEFYRSLNKRRSVREYSPDDVPKEVIESIIRAAGTAPSGAHKQPWTFCAIRNRDLKAKIREAAEKEEYDNYHGRMSDSWLKDLAPLETDWQKSFIDDAPWIIVVFRKIYDLDNGEKKKNYYVQESVGIAAGMLLAAIHSSGLVSLTHTPSPMDFLGEVLERPKNEKAFLLMPVGYPQKGAEVPYLERKALDDIAVFYE